MLEVNWLDEHGLLVFKHKTNKRLFLQRSYHWVDRLMLLDESIGRQCIMDFKFSTFDFSAWTSITQDEFKKVKSNYKEIYNDLE